MVMNSTYSVTDAQARLPMLIKEARDRPIAIQRRNTTVAYVVSRERMEAIAETLELLANPEALAAFRRDRAGKGKFFPVSVLGDEG